jgi:hypothetical protein
MSERAVIVARGLQTDAATSWQTAKELEQPFEVGSRVCHLETMSLAARNLD